MAPVPSGAAGHDVVVVGASAGGVEALRALVAGLPADLPAAVLVVLHIPRDAPSALPAILNRAGPVPARRAVDGERLAYRRVYIARADYHLLLAGRRIQLSHGPSENGHRPAVDPLFRSAADAFGPRVVAVVLSGSRDDGAAGAAAVAECGGVVVVQDPAEALHSSMPEAVLRETRVDHVLPAAGIGPLLADLSRRPAVAPSSAGTDPAGTDPAQTRAAGTGPAARAPHESGLLEADVPMAGLVPVTTDQFGVPPSEFGCPSCGGVLFEVQKASMLRYRCRVGHAWSAESLLDEQSDAVEGALWVALRALEERSSLASRIADARDRRGESAAANRYRVRAREAEHAGGLIRELIRRVGGTGGAARPEPE